jgi:hypothetical protein
MLHRTMSWELSAKPVKRLISTSRSERMYQTVLRRRP